MLVFSNSRTMVPGCQSASLSPVTAPATCESQPNLVKLTDVANPGLCHEPQAARSRTAVCGSVSQVFHRNAAAGNRDFWLVDIEYGDDFSIALGEGYLLKSSI